MKRLLAIEIIKLRQNLAFAVLFGFNILFLVGAIAAQEKLVHMNLEKMELPKGFELSMYTFPNIWLYIAYTASIFKMFLAFVVIMVTCNEYGFKTLRMQVINGYSRQEYFTGKLLLIGLMSLITLFFVFLSGTLLGFINSDADAYGKFFDKIHVFLPLFLEITAFLVMAFFFATLIKKTAFAIGVFAFWYFPVEPLLQLGMSDAVYDAMPTRSMGVLTEFPFDVSTLSTIEGGLEPLKLIAPAIYAILFAGGAYLLLFKRDL